MKKVIYPLVLSVFFTMSFSRADMTALNQKPEVPISLGVLKIPGSQIIKDKTLVNASEADGIMPKKSSIRFASLINVIEDEDRNTQNLKNDYIFNTVTSNNKYDHARSFNLFTQISPDYKINKNFLLLTKVPKSRRKESIMFVFLMNKDKVYPNQSVVAKDHPRARVHILGPKKMFKEQNLIEYEYPVDVSVAKYEDGYSSEDLNLVLPNKKPREVAVSLMWSF